MTGWSRWPPPLTARGPYSAFFTVPIESAPAALVPLSDPQPDARKTVKRSYNRRSDDERIADLEAEIARQQEKIQDRERKKRESRELSPVAKAIPKVQKHLEALADVAREHDRQDVANSVHLFLIGLQRTYEEELSKKRPEELEFEEVRELPEADEDEEL